jgi:hypothetical protein
MADPPKDPNTHEVPNNAEMGGPAPTSPRVKSFAATCSILSFFIGIPMLAGSGLCIAVFFPSIIIAGPLLLIGGVFTISGVVLRHSASIDAFIPLIVAIAATVAYFIWVNLRHGGS